MDSTHTQRTGGVDVDAHRGDNQPGTAVTEPERIVLGASREARRRRLAKRLMKLIVPFALLGVWLFVTELELIEPIFLPPPQDVFDRIGVLREDLLAGLGASLEMVVIGFAIGGAIGMLAGLAFGYSGVIRDLFEFTVDVVRPIPLFALIPLFILWFGIGRLPQITLVAMGVFLIMSLATIEAIRNVPQVYVRAALTLGASNFQVYRTVVIPAIVPNMLTGVRFAVASAWGLDVAAEFTGAQEGLGHLMIIREQSLDTAGIFLIVLIFCALAIVADRLVQLVTRYLTRWSERSMDTGLVRNMLGGP